ncbi:MAG: FMN-binding protein [Bdellovibrionales bacterium]|nr:FMN-binding protein [Bdellovibrionales bacterium]
MTKALQLAFILIAGGGFFPLPASALTEVYLSQQEALRLVCGTTKEEPTYEPQTISGDLLEELKKESLEPEDKSVAHFFRCPKESTKKSKLALIDAQVGKHLPITYIMGFDEEGKVTELEIMVYREKYGSAIKRGEFVNQYLGKDISNSLKVGTAIKHISGATISARSISKGVTRGLYLWKHFYSGQ